MEQNNKENQLSGPDSEKEIKELEQKIEKLKKQINKNSDSIGEIYKRTGGFDQAIELLRENDKLAIEYKALNREWLRLKDLRFSL
ncbi:MAG: hypothetical protein AB1779_00860 [Candidatus Thermoplasmatota archaeon]